MKKISILIIAICFSGMLKAQQLPQLTQYMINNYAVNPAVAGMYDYYQAKTTIRNQWVGITDAPRTTLLSIFGSKSEHVGLGGLVFNDQTGPTSRIGCSASYTYSFPITKACARPLGTACILYENLQPNLEPSPNGSAIILDSPISRVY